MGRRVASDALVPVRIGEDVFRFAPSVMKAVPDAIAFAAYLRSDDRTVATATRYVQLVAKARREGWLNAPEVIPHHLTLTAVNTYWRWVAQHYEARLAPVAKTLYQHSNFTAREKLGRLRMHSLVPPAPGKVIPRRGPPVNIPLPGKPTVIDDTNPPRWQPPEPIVKRVPWAGWSLEWVPSEKWTLHIPFEDDAPAHVDPCADCSVIELNDEQLGVVAEAFYKAWGRDKTPAQMPPELHLFGQPPMTSIYATPTPPAAGSIVALVPLGVMCDNVEHLRGSATPAVSDFVARVEDRNPDVVVIDRHSVGRDAARMLRALEAWMTQAAVSDAAE